MIVCNLTPVVGRKLTGWERGGCWQKFLNSEGNQDGERSRQSEWIKVSPISFRSQALPERYFAGFYSVV